MIGLGRKVALAILAVGWVLTVAIVTPLVLGHGIGHGASAPQISRAHQQIPAHHHQAHLHYVLLPEYTPVKLQPMPQAP